MKDELNYSEVIEMKVILEMNYSQTMKNILFLIGKILIQFKNGRIMNYILKLKKWVIHGTSHISFKSLSYKTIII